MTVVLCKKQQKRINDFELLGYVTTTFFLSVEYHFGIPLFNPHRAANKLIVLCNNSTRSWKVTKEIIPGLNKGDTSPKIGFLKTTGENREHLPINSFPKLAF